MMTEPPTIGPTPQAQRILALDALRGFALLGILIMNIQSFSMLGAAYLNPAADGDLTGANRLVWMFSHLAADTKFMTLFSVMFGAGVMLFTERIEARGGKPAGLYYRRTGWLIVFGLLHAYGLWHGDILFTYGVCGLALYLFRKAPPWLLLVLGLLVVSVSSLLYLFFQWSIQFMDEATRVSMFASWSPGPEEIARETAAFRGGWWAQMSQRVPGSIFMQTFLFLIMTGWRAGGLMLVGMALYRWKVLTSGRSDRFYLGCLLAGFAIGFPVVAYGVYRNFTAGWSPEYSFFLGSQFNYWGSLLVSLGYLGTIMLLCRRRWAARVMSLLAGVGRTALTNYVLQTVLCTFLFYGHGLGLFRRVPRTGQILVVLAVWVLQIVSSNLWLRHFRFGPLEWLWRSLTYGKRQPFRARAT